MLDQVDAASMKHADVVEIPAHPKTAQPMAQGMDLEKLQHQLETLETIKQRIQFELRPNTSEQSCSSDASSERFDENDDTETPPELTTSPCGTPFSPDTLSTPLDGSRPSSYFGVPLSGQGKARRSRLSSPLSSSSVTTLGSSKEDSIPEEVVSKAIDEASRSASVASVQGQVVKAQLSQPLATTSPRDDPVAIQDDEVVALETAKSRQLPSPEVLEREAVADDSQFQTIQPERDLVLPAVPKPVHPRQKPTPEEEIEVIGPPAPLVVEKPEEPLDEKAATASSTDSKASIWSRTRKSYVATYCPTDAPELVLPTAPTDAEKITYLKTNRVGLYSFGVFSFLSLSAGMWLFVLSSEYFYWFGLFVALLEVYLIISYSVSLCGKDYDYEAHKKIGQENPIDPVTAPTVDIYLPCCKEPIEVIENTYKHVKELLWPEGKLKVYVLDDGASDEVKTMAASYNFEYICRDDRPRLKKAGNLRWAFARTHGDFFAIFDADFCPRPDFLREIMPTHLAKPDTAIVQTPQFFRVKDEQTWVEQGAGAVQELFYRVVQVNRNRWGASICVGSNAVYRREALVEVGGTAEIGFSEDVHTGFYALTRGWKVRYMPLCLACGICPDTPRAFFSQQMRWCMGSTTLLTNMDFWRSSLSPIQKICYLSGMMYYSAISLSIFISPLPGILMLWIRPDYVRYYNLAFAIPSIFYSIIAMRCWSKASYGFNVQHVMVIQSYAYLTAIKDRLFGRGLAWVPSGGNNGAHKKNNKYRNMRILAICWSIAIVGALISGVTYQLIRHEMHWYDCVPLECLILLNLYLQNRFLFWHGKV